MNYETIEKIAKQTANHGVFLHPNGETGYTFYQEQLEHFVREIINTYRTTQEDSEWKPVK